MTLTETNTEELAEEEPACVCGSRKLMNLGPCRLPGVSTGSEVEKSLSQRLSPGFLYRCCECHLGLRVPRPGIGVDPFGILLEDGSTEAIRRAIQMASESSLGELHKRAALAVTETGRTHIREAFVGRGRRGLDSVV